MVRLFADAHQSMSERAMHGDEYEDGGINWSSGRVYSCLCRVWASPVSAAGRQMRELEGRISVQLTAAAALDSTDGARRMTAPTGSSSAWAHRWRRRPVNGRHPAIHRYADSDMPYEATVIKVMIASPGDVAEERAIAQDVIHEWNAVNSGDRRTVLLPVAWETHAAPAMGERAQEIINKQLLRDADLLIAVFWTRIGTPTGDHPSGSVEEVREHIRSGRPAMLYFSTTPVRPDSVDPAQFEALKTFKSECRSHGLVEEYESPSQFREKLVRQLAQTVIQRFPAAPVEASQSAASASSRVADMEEPRRVPSRPLTLQERDDLGALPDEARQLLVAAGADKDGTVLVLETMGGASISIGNQEFGERGNARSEARWKRAVRDLVSLGLLEQRDHEGQVFSVTDEGYRLVDLLSRLS